jgi:hypothetical protein
MQQLDVVCSIVVIASFVFVFGLIFGGPLYIKYSAWREKRAFRLRDERDARLIAAAQMGHTTEHSAQGERFRRIF